MPDNPIPIVVDLDDTLVRTDTLVEQLVSIVFKHPDRLPYVAGSLLQGRAAFKRQVAKAATLDFQTLPYNAGVLAYIAKTVTHNGRDLEGALNRLLAHNKLTGQSVTLEMAEREVRDLIRPQEPKRVKIEDIQRVVARQYNVSRSDLLSSRRTANVVRPRQVAMYLAKTLTLQGQCLG